MNIVHIIPGSGGSFYCGNCLRDSKYFDAIRAQEHNAIKVPMYLPLFSHDDAINGEIPVFYGAISIYLKHVFPLLRRAPGWLDRLLNAKPMLKFAAHMANSTRATGLEDMTISMLMGEHGEQKDELNKMADWLAGHYKADVIHISNALLLGLAHKLKEQLQVPVVCSLQDEHVWVDVMRPAFAKQVWSLMKEKARDIDRFVAVSHYYTSFMKDKLDIPDEKINTLHLGVDPADYSYTNASQKPRNIGFLSRMCHENGLDILVDAFVLLKKIPGHEDVRLLLTGGHTADDKKYIRDQKQKIMHAGLEESVTIMENFEQEARNAFFSQVMVLSVPVRGGEAFGIYLTEAMAAGIPVVQPALGAFPEIIEKSGGGMTYPENNAGHLAKALESMLGDKDRVRIFSQQARESIVNKFNIHSLSEEMINIYKDVIENHAHQKRI